MSAVAASIVASAPAFAAEPATRPQASDVARADAEKRLNEGLQRYAKGDYEGARLAFAQAYAVLSSIDLLYNLARAEVKSGHSLEAIVHLRQILRDPKATDDDRAKANKLLADANALTGHIAVEAPAGSEVVLDAVPSGECPIKEVLDVAPGKHVVEARLGGDVRRIEVAASPGDVVTARFAMSPAAAPTVSAPVPMSPAPAAPPAEPAPAAAEPERDRGAPPAHESKARLIVPLALGGAAVVAAGIGIAFGIASQGHESDANDFRASHPPGFCADRASSTCTQYQSILDSQQQATNAERVAFVAGGVLAVGAIATWALWPRPRTESKGAWIAPAPAGVRAGITF